MTARWYYRLPVKVTAVFLTALLFFGGLTLVGGAGLSVLIAGAEGTTEMAQRQVAEYFLSLYDWEIARDYVQTGTVDEVYTDMPYTYTLTDETGTLLVSTYDGGDYLAYSHDIYYYSGDGGKDYRITATLYCPSVAELTGDSWLEVGVRTVTWWHTNRWLCLGGGGLCWVLMLAVFVFLCSVAGWHNGQSQPTCNPIDRIPFDLFTVLYVTLGCAPLYWLYYVDAGASALVFILLFFIMLLELALVFSFVMSVVTRVKTRTLWRNTVVGRLLRLCGRGLAAVGRHLPLVWKTLLLLAAVSVVEFIVIVSNFSSGAALLGWWLVGKLLLVPLVLLLALGLRRLQRGVQEIAAGRVEHQINVEHLPGELRRTAQQLNHIGDGLSGAVEARLKSERFKTELITNVSHDIKTPLTSIINYVDLMEKQQPEDPVLQEYLEVLQRQSARLKKLIEDLIEASKASTGNLAVERAPCQLGVLLEQTVGEYTEKAERGQLTLLLQQPEQPVTVLADGRHLWRVFDNLLNNICKYAQPGTRVYLDLAVRQGAAHITFRNISRTPLHISGEELMERFVRGDSSRHTEGSGLGLSIARSLIELQGGTLALTVDGDLFKVELTLPILNV